MPIINKMPTDDKITQTISDKDIKEVSREREYSPRNLQLFSVFMAEMSREPSTTPTTPNTRRQNPDKDKTATI